MRKFINGQWESSTLVNSKATMKFLEGDYTDHLDYYKFVLLWMSFNSYFGEQYKGIKKPKDQQDIGLELFKVLKFVEENSSIFDKLFADDTEFKNILREFKRTSNEETRTSVVDEGGKKPLVYFDDDHKNCEDFFNVLYRIRCNLFHGVKELERNDNKKLVSWAYKYFNIFWNEFLNNK